MSRKSVLKSLAFAGLTLSLAAGSAYAQGGKEKEKGKPAEDISTKARNVKPELKEAYKKWLSTDVDYIITKEEKRAFLALQTDEERENFTKLLASGFVDTFREFEKGPGHYSWWSQMMNCRSRNIGWRVDYFVASQKLKTSLRRAWISPEVMGSDHCPVGLEIA